MKSIKLLSLALVVGMLFSRCEEDGSPQPADENVFDEEMVIDELSGANPNLQRLRSRGWRVTQAPVLRNSDKKQVGLSYVVRYKKGIFTLLKSNELEPGTAVTLWLVLFNAPENCEDGCNGGDFPNPDVRADLVYAGGRVIRAHGQAVFISHRRVGDLSGSMASILFGGPARGIEDVRRVEPHLVIRSHGQVIPELREAMISTFNGGCQGLPPEAGEPGPNTCANIQSSVHLRKN